MQKQKVFNLSLMPKMVLIITLVVMLGLLFGAVSYLLKTPKTDLPIVSPVVENQENYYDVLEKKCGGDSCCLDVIEFMQEYNYKETDENGNCPERFYRVMGKNCEHLLRWCVPIEESYCIDEQNNRRELGEIISESPTMFKRCDRFGNISNYYILSCSDEKLVISNGFGVISRKTPSESFFVGGEGMLGFTWTIDNNKYKTFSGGPGNFFVACDKEKTAIFYSHLVEIDSNDYTYNKRFFDGNSVAEISCSFRKEDTGVISKFEDGKRVYDFKPLENGKEICQKIKERYQELEKTTTDTSNWQTYRNEEFGFEYSKDFEIIYEDIKEIVFDDRYRDKHPEECVRNPQCLNRTFSVESIKNGKIDNYKDRYSELDGGAVIEISKNGFIDGQKAKWGYMPAVIDTVFIVIQTPSGDIVKISSSGPNAYSSTEENFNQNFNQILSTFKFIEK